MPNHHKPIYLQTNCKLRTLQFLMLLFLLLRNLLPRFQRLLCLCQLLLRPAPIALRDGDLLLELLHRVGDAPPQGLKDGLGLVQGSFLGRGLGL